jgi:hypothetical protein
MQCHYDYYALLKPYLSVFMYPFSDTF